MASGTSPHAPLPYPPGEGEDFSYTFHFTEPGVYRFTARWSASWPLRGERLDVWRRDLVSNAVEIRVVPGEGNGIVPPGRVDWGPAVGASDVP